MEILGVAEWVYDVVAECVNNEDAIHKDLDLWRVFVEVEGHRDGSQLRPVNYVSLWLQYNFDVGGGLCLWINDGRPQCVVPLFLGSVRV